MATGKGRAKAAVWWGQWEGLRVTGMLSERGGAVVVLTDVQTDQWFRESGRRAANGDGKRRGGQNLRNCVLGKMGGRAILTDVYTDQ